MVRLHDQYNMHGIFAPGFPGLLESFYVQERLMEAIMPDVYQSFVSASTSSVTSALPASPLVLQSLTADARNAT